MKTLIVGAGIAGLTLADQLFWAGHQVVLVERAAHLRAGGYMIDLFGPGFDVAEEMGLRRELESLHYPIARRSFHGSDGRERWSLDYSKTQARWFGSRHASLMRGELIGVLHRRVHRRVPIRFNESISRLEQNDERVHVTFASGGRERYDVVIGADGVSSTVRGLAFPVGSWQRRSLGLHTAAFVLDRDSDALRDIPDNVFASLSVVGRQVSVHPIRGNRLATFFLHSSSTAVVRPDAGTGPVCADLVRIYGDLGWWVPAVLDGCPGEGLYYEQVDQVVMDSWSHGRIGLVGDACGCVSLVAGQGASLAMLGASVLGEELRRSPREPALALWRYERRVRPVVESRQKAGRRMARWLVPRTRARIAVRDGFMRLAARPVFAGLARWSFVGA